MEGKRRVEVINTANAQVSIRQIDLHFDHTWQKKNDKFMIDFDLLEQMLYDNGTRTIFEDGVLYIKDMQTKIDLGLEPEGAEEPENIIVLEESQMKRYMTVLPLHEFKENLDKMSNEQCLALVQFAIKNKTVDFDKFEYLQKRTGVDAYRAIKMEKEAEEG